MRIRSTKPEFWRSKTVAQFDWGTRLVLKGLESYVDDNGVGKDDLALIAADVFPRDLSENPRDTLARLSEAISMLSAHGLVVRYEANGEDLLYIDRWRSIQRIDKPAKGRFPRPDGTLDYAEEVSRESYASPRDTLAPVTEEQRIRGTDSCASADAERETDDLARWRAQDQKRTRKRDQERYAEFDQWWEHYPRKRSKGQAMKAYKAARKKVSREVLLEAIQNQRDRLVERGDEFCPYPSTWLNGERWADEVDPPQQSQYAAFRDLDQPPAASND